MPTTKPADRSQRQADADKKFISRSVKCITSDGIAFDIVLSALRDSGTASESVAVCHGPQHCQAPFLVHPTCVRRKNAQAVAAVVTADIVSRKHPKRVEATEAALHADGGCNA